MVVAVVRVIVENRSERPLRRVRIERSDDGTVLSESRTVPYGQHLVMERSQDENFEWRLSFDQDGQRHTFDGFELRATYAELKVITVTPGPCIYGERGRVSDLR